MSDPRLQSLPRGVKNLHFVRTLKSSHVALHHTPYSQMADAREKTGTRHQNEAL